MIQFRVKRNEISPDIRRKLRNITNCRPVLEAVGLRLASLTSRACPALNNKLTPLARKKIDEIARAKIEKMLK